LIEKGEMMKEGIIAVLLVLFCVSGVSLILTTREVSILKGVVYDLKENQSSQQELIKALKQDLQNDPELRNLLRGDTGKKGVPGKCDCSKGAGHKAVDLLALGTALQAMDKRSQPESCYDERRQCEPGDMRICGATTVGACEFGTRFCQPDCIWAEECLGAVYPETGDTCQNGYMLDSDCDGYINATYEISGAMVTVEGVETEDFARHTGNFTERVCDRVISTGLKWSVNNEHCPKVYTDSGWVDYDWVGPNGPEPFFYRN
jgi:hypothetical protein